MDVREKLVELLNNIGAICIVHISVDQDGCGTNTVEGADYIADFLITNGVTIPTKCNECEFFRDGTCKNAFGLVSFEENLFCAYAERKGYENN
jgi:hypothetical protein